MSDKLKKAITSLLLCTAVMIHGLPAFALELTSQAAIVIDAASGEVYYEMNADTPLAPASMTKVMTTYIIYEKIAEGVITKDTIITADDDDYDASTDPEATNVTLYPGHEYSIDELIGAIMVPSACAASAMAGKYISGSEAEFALLMNETAGRLGLEAYYEDASGLSDNNRISARSMAKLARELITKYPDVLNYTVQPYIIFEDRRYNSTNSMLTGKSMEYDYTDGLKTGTTNLAGACFTATSVRDNNRLISVTMHSGYGTSRFEDSIQLLDYGFDIAYSRHNTVYATDMRVKINDEEIPAFLYNNGLSCIIEDLKDYGFDVIWQEESKTVAAQYTGKPSSPIPMEMYRAYLPGQTIFDVVPDAGINAVVKGADGEDNILDCHSVGSYAVISADRLSEIASGSYWNEGERTLNIYFSDDGTVTLDNLTEPNTSEPAEETAAPEVTPGQTSEQSLEQPPEQTDDASIYAEEIPEVDTRMIFAADSQLISRKGELYDMTVSPFVYNDTSYVPVEDFVIGMGGTVEYNGDDNSLTASYNGKSFLIPLSGVQTRIYEKWVFYPVLDICDALGFNLKWYGGIFSVSEQEPAMTRGEIDYYTDLLRYGGYTDEYFRPRTVVDPYKTYTYDQMNEDIRVLSRMYPDLIHDAGSIGTTAEGREITSFTFGKGPVNIIVCASMHAREYIATNVLMYLVDSYAMGYVNDDHRDGYSFRSALDNYSFIVIPMVNPDGINLSQHGYDTTKNPDYVKSLSTNGYGFRGWKANANGVDLNNNFDWLWYAKGSPSYAGYGGPYGASEYETQAMQSLIMNTDFKIFLSFHTQGQVVYWMDPNCDQDLYGIFKPHIDRLCDEIGFDEMPSDGTTGYSGYMTDYVRKFKRTMAMTVELCPYIGDYPYPESDFDTVAYPVRNIMLILADIAQYL